MYFVRPNRASCSYLIRPTPALSKVHCSMSAELLERPCRVTMHMQMTSDNDETSQAAVVVAQKADEHNSLAGHLPKCAASARRQAAEGSKCSACPLRRGG